MDINGLMMVDEANDSPLKWGWLHEYGARSMFIIGEANDSLLVLCPRNLCQTLGNGPVSLGITSHKVVCPSVS